MLSESDFKAKQIIFITPKNGEKLLFRNDNVIIVDQDGVVVHQSTCYRLFAIFVVGHITITSGLIQRAKKFGFSIVLMTVNFKPYRTISAFAQANVLLRRRQYNYRNINSAQRLIWNKINNQKKLLMSVRNRSDAQNESIMLLENYRDKIYSCKDIYEIMGVEGNASRVYFKNYFNNIMWISRKPRIKFDMINSLMDIGYTILFSFIDAMVGVYGFDSYVGILHRQFYMRKSLICDLVEPFRVIIDNCIRKGINLNQFKADDFEIISDKWQLKYSESSKYSAIFVKALMEYKNDIYLYIRSVYRCFMKGSMDNNFPQWEYY